MMYGVVLWSDQVEGKAVIWCEDHGDLAFYSAAPQSSMHAGCMLDAGDLIHFEVRDAGGMRCASQPELVAEEHAPALAERLKGASGHANSPAEPRDTVVPFPLARSA